ncbi:hypothetical protein [Nannocystis pusilla]|uniref:hypothetical protein n=1 Tax=Nannocystis pusilla TaxID=889268 RepID=UPI003B79FC58
MIAIASLFVVALAAPPSDAAAVPDPRRAASPDSAASQALAVDTDELERILRESPSARASCRWPAA